MADEQQETKRDEGDEILAVSPTQKKKESEIQEKTLEMDLMYEKGPRPSMTSPGGLIFSWSNVSYMVTLPKTKETKQILFNVTGSVKPGEMVAVMGTSGSGKTSLLNVLSGRNVKGTVIGDIYLNHEPRSKTFKRFSAYVEQDDYLFPNLTVLETFQFTALLRLDGSMTKEQKLNRANEVIQELGLSHCVNTRIGSPIARGVSGGERKRVSVGVDLITDPKILFLDEPTSGLDSSTAYHLCKSMKNLAANNRAVLCTIHQPRSDIFFLFDKLVLLSQGKLVYYGPVSESVQYFESCKLPLPLNTNPADFFLDMATVDGRQETTKAATQERVDMLVHSYANSQYHQLAIEEAQSFEVQAKRRESIRSGLGTKEEKAALDQEDEAYHETWNLLWIMEFYLLVQRSFLNSVRDPRATKANIGQSVIIAIMSGIVFLQLGRDQESIQSRTGALFFASLNQAFVALTSALMLFQSEKAAIHRERAAGTYRMSSFYFAKTFGDLPPAIFANTLFIVIFYFLVGFEADATQFFIFWFLVLCNTLTAQSVGLFVSALSPNLQIAQVVAPLILLNVMLFGGFYVNSADIWIGLTWLEHISFIKYTFAALAVNEYSGASFSCDVSNSTIESHTGRCQSSGEMVLAGLGMENVKIWEEWGKLIAIAVGCRILAYIALRYFNKPEFQLKTVKSNPYDDPTSLSRPLQPIVEGSEPATPPRRSLAV